ncbi:Rubredoxin, partial [Dysosmobacter welbionis]
MRRLRIRKVENRSRQDGMCAKSPARRSVLPSFQKDRHPEIPDACPSAFESAAS